MADKTTLTRCAEFFRKHGWPKDIQYEKSLKHWLVRTENNATQPHTYDRKYNGNPWVYSPVCDAIATALLKEHLWEMLCKGVPIDYPQRGHDISGFVLVIQPGKSIEKRYYGRDELALLLQAAEETK